MALDQSISERIAQEFSAGDQPLVRELLRRYAGPESGRVARDVLILSKGRVDQVKRFVEEAQNDYRNVLDWAEYYDTDPMLRGRDSRAWVDDILAKWGERKPR